jgi:pilus assembly protein CpaB
VSRRARAAAFAALALACAALAGSLAGEYTEGVEAQLGELRAVIVAQAELRPGRPIRPGDTRELLDVRRVPSRFAPADALTDPFQAVGRTPVGRVPAGAYLTDSLLRVPRRSPRGEEPPPGASEVVEIEVAGAGALATGGDPVGRTFDVVATGEPRPGGGGGRTRVVADGVELLDLREAGPPAGELVDGAGASWVASLGAGRAEAIRLIQAHNYAREVRLIGGR